MTKTNLNVYFISNLINNWVWEQLASYDKALVKGKLNASFA
jgi:hypothetical protein